MTKQELLTLALQTTLINQENFSPLHFISCDKQTFVKMERLYQEAKRQRNEILAIIAGKIELENK